MGMRAAAAVVLVAALLAGCSDGVTPHKTTTPTAAATPTPAARPAPDRYAQLVLADAPVALWPLGDSQHGAAAVGQAWLDAVLTGTVMGSSVGPVLLGEGRRAAQFNGRSRLVSPLVLGKTPNDAWSVDFWFRGDGCGSTFERIAGNSVVSPTGREGIDVFHYPTQARASCRIGAELWSAGRFLGGCATADEPPVGVWRHYAITRTSTLTRCYVDGKLVNQRSGAGATVAPGATWGIGGSGTGYGAALRGGLADLAVYERALPGPVVLAHARAGR